MASTPDMLKCFVLPNAYLSHPYLSPMLDPKNFTFESLLYGGLLFIGIVSFVEIGFRVGQRRSLSNLTSKEHGMGAVESAVFALFGLLLAFVFSGATTRFDHRRDLIVQEANAIGTAYLRMDLLPEASQAEMRSLFKTYVQSRVTTFEKYRNAEMASAEYAHSLQLQNTIWHKATSLAKSTGNTAATSLVLSSLNDMIDITTTRLVASRTHPPEIIYLALFALALTAALLVGYSMSSGSRRPWVHVLIFAVAITATIYVILDIEYPRFGLVRIDAADKVMVELLDGMK